MVHQGKRLKALIVHLQREGATVRATHQSGKIMIYPADKTKEPIAVHATPGDHRNSKNLKSMIERAGHTYPFSD